MSQPPLPEPPQTEQAPPGASGVDSSPQALAGLTDRGVQRLFWCCFASLSTSLSWSVCVPQVQHDSVEALLERVLRSRGKLGAGEFLARDAGVQVRSSKNFAKTPARIVEIEPFDHPAVEALLSRKKSSLSSVRSAAHKEEKDFIKQRVEAPAVFVIDGVGMVVMPLVALQAAAHLTHTAIMLKLANAQELSGKTENLGAAYFKAPQILKQPRDAADEMAHAAFRDGRVQYEKAYPASAANLE